MRLNFYYCTGCGAKALGTRCPTCIENKRRASLGIFPKLTGLNLSRARRASRMVKRAGGTAAEARAAYQAVGRTGRNSN